MRIHNGHQCPYANQSSQIHPYAKVLAMFAFDSYSQSKRSPRPLSGHRPCKTPFPIGNASFNKPWPNYHGSIRFWSNPIGTPVSNGPFFVGTVDAHKQKREAGPFPSLYIAGWVLIKEKTRSKTRSKRGTEKAPHLHTWTLARKPQTCPSLDHW